MGTKTGHKNSFENLPENRATLWDPTRGQSGSTIGRICSDPSWWWWRFLGGSGELEISNSVHVVNLFARERERERVVVVSVSTKTS